MQATIPIGKDITNGVRAAMARAHDQADWYRSKAIGRQLGGDLLTAERYADRSAAYAAAAQRLDATAGRLGLGR